jgi:hypothetical protein
MPDANISTIEPEEMPSFLNELASKYFKDDPDTMLKLAQCSMYIHTTNYIHSTRR